MGEEEGEKIKKRGRGREGGKVKKEKENNCIQNVIIKKQKDIAKKNFFFAGTEQSRLSQAEYERILCYMIPVCQECH